VRANSREILILGEDDRREGYEQHAPERRTQELCEHSMRKLTRVFAYQLGTVAQ